MQPWRPWLTTALAGLMTAACADSAETLRRHGYSEAYVAGYHDGCPSGKASAGELLVSYQRDESAYAAGGEYRTGWDYGYTNCAQAERTMLEAARALGDSLAATGSSHGADGFDARKILDGIDTSGLEALDK